MVDEVTEVDPSPVVETVGVKEPLKVPEPGKFVMLGFVGVGNTLMTETEPPPAFAT